jgi:hypothetical protein
MRLSRWMLAFAVLPLAGCDSKTTSSFDADLLAKIETIEDCFPNLWVWVDGLLQIADTWKQQDGVNPPDPPELNWSVVGMDIDASLTVGSTTIQMLISFYGPNGAKQDAATLIGSATQLSDAMDNAATQLRNDFPLATEEKHIHGVWNISGGGISATGEALNGEIGGVSNQNELEVLRTTIVPVITGIPANDPSTITDNGPPVCTLTFNIPALFTDEEPGQEYPRGDVAITVVGPEATVDATISFNKTAIATITIAGVNGSFAFNVETREITFNP